MQNADKVVKYRLFYQHLYYGPVKVTNETSSSSSEYQAAAASVMPVQYDDTSAEVLEQEDYSDLEEATTSKSPRLEKFIDIEASSPSEQQTHEFLLDDLLKYSTYRFRLVALDSSHNQTSGDDDSQDDLANSSAELVMETPSDVPDAAPEAIQAETLNTSSILLQWALPPVEKRNGLIIGYKIAVKENDKQVWNSNVDSEPRRKIIAGLMPGHKYSFRITARTINGSGPVSDWFTAETFTREMDGLCCFILALI